MIRTSSAIKILGKDGIWHRILTIKGDKGEQGERGETGVAGRDGRDGIDGRDGRDGINPVYITNSKDDIPTDPDKSIMIVTEAEGEDVLGKISESIEANADAIEKQQQLMPTNEPTVGKLARVAEVFADGTFRMEWIDEPSGGVSDVTVNGASVVTNGVAAVPVADYPTAFNTGTLGLVKLDGYSGLNNENGRISVKQASDFSITNRINPTGVTGSIHGWIHPGNMDFAVLSSLTDNNCKVTWDAAKQQAACERLGAEQKKQYQLILRTEYTGLQNEDITINLGAEGYEHVRVFMALPGDGASSVTNYGVGTIKCGGYDRQAFECGAVSAPASMRVAELVFDIGEAPKFKVWGEPSSRTYYASRNSITQGIAIGSLGLSNYADAATAITVGRFTGTVKIAVYAK